MATEALRKTLLWLGLLFFAVGVGIIFTVPSAAIVGYIIGTVGLMVAIIAVKRIWRQMRWARH